MTKQKRGLVGRWYIKTPNNQIQLLVDVGYYSRGGLNHFKNLSFIIFPTNFYFSLPHYFQRCGSHRLFKFYTNSLALEGGLTALSFQFSFQSFLEAFIVPLDRRSMAPVIRNNEKSPIISEQKQFEQRLQRMEEFMARMSGMMETLIHNQSQPFSSPTGSRQMCSGRGSRRSERRLRRK